MSETTTGVAPQPGLQTFKLVDAQTLATSGGGCGCGGHGSAGGCGCGGHGHSHAEAHSHSEAHAHSGAHAHADSHADSPEGPAGADAEELDVHAIPHVVRRQVLLGAVDALPVGESLLLRAPHQPEPLFDHLRDSEAHYRVATLESGPQDWRYRITRLS